MNYITRYAEISFLIIMLSVSLPAQNYSWMHEWNGGAGNNAIYHNSIADNSGNYYVSGYVSYPSAGGSFCLTKFTSSGGISWVRYFEPGGYSDPALLAFGPTGNIYVWTDRIVKIFTPGGDSVWQFGINTSNHFAIHITPMSEVILLDYWQDTQTLKTGFHIAKHDSLGVRIWDHTFYEPASGEIAFLSDFEVGNDSCYYITGFAPRSGSTLIVTTKILQNGLTGWQKMFNRGATPFCYSASLACVSDGSLFVGGTAGTTNGSSSFRTLLLKYSPGGDLLWEKTLDPGNDEDRIFNLAVTADGAVFCSGASNAQTIKRAMLLKYSAAGDLLSQYFHEPLHWMPTTDPRGALYFGFFLNISAGKVYISGTTFSAQDFHKATILKFNEQGSFLDYVKGISAEYGIWAGNTFLRNGSVTISGRLAHQQNQSMFYLVNYTDQNITDVSDSELIPEKGFILEGNYPNPFNPATRIIFHSDQSGTADIKFYDPAGNEISRPVIKEISAGRNEVEFYGNDLSSGVYFYTISLRNRIRTGKMLLLK